MGKITINEMNKSLFNYAQAVSDENLMTESKTIVGAINEIYGKRLITDSIGEPLSNTDTFTKMSNDINSLLSTFKTNMMNNGITVEANDKFKALIDKIATMVEEGSGKGIQYITGTEVVNSDKVAFTSKDSNYNCRYIDLTFDFDPNIILVTPTKGSWFSGTINVYIKELGYVYISTYQMIATNNFTVGIAIDSKVKKGNGIYRMPLDPNMSGNVMWYAIGVGEEDTTLRDSLADILENKGVDVTEEDDMASLITKVDSISGGLDIISATELPATGNNMQLCAITDNVTDSFILSNEEADVILSGNNTIGLHLSDLTMYEKYSYPMGGLVINLRIASTYQNASAIPLWLYYNNAWVQICSTKVIAINNKILQDGFTMGKTNSYGYYGETAGLVLRPGNNAILFGFTPFNNTIDFSKYKAIRIKGTYQNTTSSTGTYGPGIGIFGRSTNLGGGTNSGVGFGLSSTTSTFEALFSYTKTFNSSVTTSTPFDFTFDISKTNTCYLGIVTAMTEYTYITDLEFILK